MAEITTGKLLQVYRERFGMVATPYPTFVAKNGYAPGAGTTFLADQFRLPEPPPGDYSFEATSLLGTPVLLPLKLDGWLLPIEPLVRVTGGKRIVETELVGLDGSVKELINRKDYTITIAGLLLADTTSVPYPDADARRLKRLVDTPGAVAVEHQLLNLLGIRQLVIEADEWPEMEAQPGQQLYRLECKQDRLYSLELDPNGKFQFISQ